MGECREKVCLRVFFHRKNLLARRDFKRSIEIVYFIVLISLVLVKMASKIYDVNKYEVYSQDVFISSTRRNKDQYPKPNGYVVDIDTELKNIIECEMTVAKIPYSFGNIDKTNNKVHFEVDITMYKASSAPAGAPSPVKFQETGYLYVAPGQYTIPEIAEEVQRLFSEGLFSGSPVLVVKYNENTGQFHFQLNRGTVGYPLNNPSATYYNTPYDLIIGQAKLFFKDKPQAMSRELGYSPETVEVVTKGFPGPNVGDPNIPAIYFDSTGWKYDTEYTYSIIGGQHIVNDPFTHLIVRLNDELGGGSYNDAVTLREGGDTTTPLLEKEFNKVTNMFGYIPINTDPGGFIQMGQQSGAFRTVQAYEKPVDKSIRSIRVDFFDENGNHIDFKDVDHSFILKFTMMRRKDSFTQFSTPVYNDFGNLDLNRPERVG